MYIWAKQRLILDNLQLHWCNSTIPCISAAFSFLSRYGAWQSPTPIVQPHDSISAAFSFLSRYTHHAGPLLAKKKKSTNASHVRNTLLYLLLVFYQKRGFLFHIIPVFRDTIGSNNSFPRI